MKKAILLSASLMLLSTAVFAQMLSKEAEVETKRSANWQRYVHFSPLLPPDTTVSVGGLTGTGGGTVSVTFAGVPTAAFEYSGCSKNAQGAYELVYTPPVDAMPATVDCVSNAAESTQ